MSYRILGLIGLLAMAGIASAQPPALPGKVNLVDKFQKMGIPLRDQGKRDVCSLFAITALSDFESAKINDRPHVRLSEEFLIWAANEATGLKGDQAMFHEAVHGLNALGICSKELMPYESRSDVQRKPSAAAMEDAKGLSRRWQVQWIKRWDVKRPLSDTELLAIKKALASGHPVACGLRWPNSPRVRDHELLEVPLPDKVYDGHSIVFVGYEDDPMKNGGGVFVFRNHWGSQRGNNGYGIMAYAYARAYANDALWLQLSPPNSEVPFQRFEAESLTVLAKGWCDTSPQDMSEWGGPMWSQGQQLFCGAQMGGFVEMGFSVRKAGRYRLRVLATAAPDFGKIRVTLDDQPLKQDVDLYCGRVCPSGSLELGTFDLTVSQHSLRFTVVGKNATSTNYFLGLDAIDLISTK